MSVLSSVTASMKMSNPEDNGLNKDFRVCRGCLATDAKFYDLHENDLAQAFGEFTGTSLISTYDLPPYICSICLHMIFKFQKYRRTCHSAIQKLQELLLNNQEITTNNLQHIDKSPQYCTRTNIETMSFIPTDNDDKQTDVKDKSNYIDMNVKDTSENIEEVLLNDIGGPIQDNFIKKEDPYIKNDEDDDFFDDTQLEDDLPIIAIRDKLKNFKAIKTENDFNNSDTEELPKKVLRKRKAKEKDSRKDSKKTKRNKSIKEKEKKVVCRRGRAAKDIKRQEEIVEKKDLLTARDAVVKDMDGSHKNACLFYNCHPKRKPTNKEIDKRMSMLDNFSKTYNVDVRFLTKEEQKMELEERKNYYKNMPHICQLCFRGYGTMETYMAHMEVHDPAAGDFECDICLVRCKSHRDKNKHTNQAHSKRFTCRLCGTVTKSQCYAKAHAARHSGSATYGCDQCDKRFSHQTNYLAHVRSAHGEKTQTCPICGDSLIGRLGLKVHMGIVHKQSVVCENCNTHFHNSESLSRHLHPDKTCPPNVRPCPMCGENFASEKAMRQHYEQSHEGEFRCEQCNKVYSNKWKYSIHMQEHSKKQQGKPSGSIICEMCGKGSFKYHWELVNHQRLHTGEKPFKCTVCSKTFRISTLLTSHMRVHTDERRYKCPHCPKAFHQSAHRKAHLLTHTKERPYACSMCPKTYTSASAAKEHADRTHRGLPSRKVIKREQMRLRGQQSAFTNKPFHVE